MGVAHESMGPGRRIPPRVGGGVRGPGRHRHRSPVVCPADARDGPHAVATVVGAINAMPAKASTDLQNRVYAALTLVLAAPDYIVQK